MQIGLYWLKNGDTLSKVFLKAPRAKKDNEYISALKGSDDAIVTDDKEIRTLSRDALSNIVGCPMNMEDRYKEKLFLFLEPLEDSIPEHTKTLLGRPFIEYEIESTVLSLKKGNAPGPDGIQAKVLQEMLPYACKDICDLLNWWRRACSLPETVNTGLIKLIPKGQDKMETKNYRPLTMLNTIYKKMAKALAVRIKATINRTVHPMQFGFVQGRSIHEAIWNVLTAVDWAQEQEEEYFMINMELEKAYDRVSWEYILAVARKMGLGYMFVHMVNTLFQNARALVQVNGYVSESFQLARSVRQGCPLAPLLFAIAIDPLLRNLEIMYQRRALKRLPLPNGAIFLAQLFADDNCNIVRYERGSISALMEVYENFCEVSGSKIAPHKTECLRLTHKEDIRVARLFGLTCVEAETPFKYLGCIGLGLTAHQNFQWF